MRITAAAVLMTGALVALSTPPDASTVFGDRASYEAAVGPILFEMGFGDGTDTAVDGASFSPEVIFSSPEAAGPDRTKVFHEADNNAITDAGNVGPVDAVFTTPVAAFLLDFTGGTVSPTLDLYDAAGALLMSIVAPDPRGKLGVRSEDGSVIARFTVSNGFLPDGARERYYFDELQVNALVPLPATAILLLSALGVGAVGRFRRR